MGKYLVENPSLKEWVEANPTLGEKKKKEWGDKIGDKDSQYPEGYYFHIAAKGCVFYNKEFLEDNTNDSATSRLNCPAGKEFYQTQGILGVGKRDFGCLPPCEAESLRQKSDQNALNSINNSLQNIRNSAQQSTYNVKPQVPTYRPPVRCTN